MVKIEVPTWGNLEEIGRWYVGIEHKSNRFWFHRLQSSIEKNSIFTHMKRMCAVVVVAWMMSSCSYSPTQLADDYCSCMKEFEQGKADADECREMAESHFLKLQDDDEGLNVYTQYVSDCMTYDEIRTQEDKRLEREERREKQK